MYQSIPRAPILPPPPPTRANPRAFDLYKKYCELTPPPHVDSLHRQMPHRLGPHKA